jgi:eukaryotic-like serine/threonine-protein kinase
MAGDGEFRRLGPYVLLRTSGAGGMGRIDLALRAQPDGIAKLCVLKRMHAELRSQEQDARFRREASIALQLSHDAIAQTVGIEEIDGELVLLQELVHGVDLKLLETRLATAGERVPLAVAVHIVSEIARALAYAHDFGDRGIVHRDVTPDNVMLAFSGDVKLVDFGIARSDVDATLTSTGHIVGRPTYTAPEISGRARAPTAAATFIRWASCCGSS